MYSRVADILNRFFEYILLVLFSIISLIIYSKNYASYQFISISLVMGTVTYIILNRYLDNKDLSSIEIKSKKKSILFSIIFFLFYGLSFLTILDSFYTKNIWYYLFISICTGSIFAEIIFSDIRTISLFKIILIYLNLSLSNQIIFPLGIGNPDNFYHINIVSSILESGNIPQGYSYSTFPSQHLLTSFFVSITNIALPFGYHYLGAILMAMGPIFIFIIGRKFFDIRFGLLSALLYISSDYLIYWGAHPVQMSFMYPIILVLFTLVFYILENRKGYVLLYLIITIDMIFLHNYSSMIFVFILLTIFIVEYDKKSKCNDYDIKSFGLFQIFLLMLFVHWLYYSFFFNSFIKMTEEYIYIFQDISNSVITQTYYDKLPVKFLIVNEVGTVIMIFLSIIGFYYFYRNRSFFGQIIISLFILFMVLIAIGSFFNVIWLLPNRIYAFMQELSMVFLGSAAILWINNSNKLSIKLFLILLVISLQFFSSSSTIAGFETSPFLGGQAYWKFYETPYERNAISWIENKKENDSIYINPSFISMNISYEKLQKIPIKRIDDKFIVDLKNMSNNSYFLFSKFDIYAGFMHKAILKTAHVGSYDTIKMDVNTTKILDENRQIFNIYNNGILDIYGT